QYLPPTTPTRRSPGGAGRTGSLGRSSPSTTGSTHPTDGEETVPRPLSPAFLLTFAQALVDDAATADDRDDSAIAANAKDGGWSATFVHHAGYWSHFDYRMGTSVWPLPATS